METLRERFWSKVDIKGPDDCWLWKLYKDKDGYGSFGVSHGNSVRAHRFSWELTNGLIPDGLNVLHNCPGGDNPSCVNPKHLWLGTNLDNILDMDRKGRRVSCPGDRNGSRLHPETRARGNKHGSCTHPESIVKGERHGMAKITEKDVIDIRLKAKSALQSDLAKEYGISIASVSNIVNFKNWKHVGLNNACEK